MNDVDILWVNYQNQKKNISIALVNNIIKLLTINRVIWKKLKRKKKFSN